jgi:hypothetical protein
VPYAPRDKWEYGYWASLDTVLSNLVDQLRASGYEHALEVEFRQELKFPEIVSNPGTHILFPDFSGKGKVTILEENSGEVLYRSGG